MLLRSWLARWASKTFTSRPRVRRSRRAVGTPAAARIQPLEPRVLLAATPVGGEFQVNTHTIGLQAFPAGRGTAVASDADGNFVVTWQSYSQDGDGYGVFAQRYDAAGVAQGGEFQVNTHTTGDQLRASVAMDDDGDFVIAWMGFGQDGSSYGIFAQRYDAAGVAQGGEFQVNTYTTSTQESPRLAMDADGDFVVAWHSYTQDGNSHGIFAQRYNAAGIAQGGEFQVNSYTTSTQRDARVAMDADGDFVIAWQSSGQDGSSYGVFAQRYDAAGVAQGGEFQVNTFTTSVQRVASVAMDEDGNFVVAWQSYLQDGSGYGVFAQRYNAAGVAQDAEFQVNTYTTSEQRGANVAMDANGDFVVTWDSVSQDGSSIGIFAQRYDAAGVAQDAEFQVNTYTTHDQQNVNVAMDADGDFVVIWQSYAQDGNSHGIFGQRFRVPHLTTVTNLISAGDPVTEGERLVLAPTSLTVAFTQDLNTTGGATGVNSVTNPANWQLTRDGVDVTNLVTSISFTNNGGGGPFEATLNFATALAAGDYELTAQPIGSVFLTRDARAGFLQVQSVEGSSQLTFTDVRATATVGDATQLGGQISVALVNTSSNLASSVVDSVAVDGSGNYTITINLRDDGTNSTATLADIQAAIAGHAGAAALISASATASGGSGPATGTDTYAATAPAQLTGGQNTENNDVLFTDARPLADRDDYTLAVEFVDASPSQTLSIAVSTGVSSKTISITLATDTRGNVVTTAAELAMLVNNHVDASAELGATASGDGSGVLQAIAATTLPNAADTLLDLNGGALDGDGDGTLGGSFTRNFSVQPAVPFGPEFQVNTYTTEVQQFGEGSRQTIAMDAAGNYVVTWASYGQDGDCYGVYAQRYNAAGVKQGAEFQVNIVTTGHQFDSSVAMDDAGNFVITWTDLGQDGDGGGIYARRYNAAGIAQGGEFLVNTTTTSDQTAATVAMDANGDFVITWTGYDQDGDGYGVFAQRYNAAGVAQGGEFPVNTVTTDNQFNSVVAMDADGDFVIVWASYYQDGDAYGIYAQRYNASGVAQGGEFQVNTYTTSAQLYAAVAMDAAGNFVISWTSDGPDGDSLGIVAQRYDAAGVAQGTEFTVNTYTTGLQLYSSVAMDDDGDFVIAWTDFGQSNYDIDVYGQRYDAAGVAQGTEFRINTYTTDEQLDPQIAMDADGDFVVAWMSYDQDGDTMGIFAQRYHSDIAPVLNNASFTISENRPNGYVVGTMTATDADLAAGDVLSYAITAGNTGNAFSVNANGQITVANSIAVNFETNPSFTLTVEVTDAALMTDTATVMITINNLNEAPFAFSKSFSINENLPVGTAIGAITTTDQDAGQTLTYSITAGNTGNAFIINATTGEITVNNATPLNFEVNPTFNLQVTATDNGSPQNSRIGTAVVSLLNVNEPPAFVAPTTFTIAENRPVGYAVGVVDILDPEGNSVTYSIVGGDPNGQFAINTNTGQITVAKATINFEATPQFLLQVRATDNGVPAASRTQTITVNVTNLNEPPVFAAPTTFTIAENRPVGYAVGTVNTVDPEGNAVTYSLVGGDPNGQFAINANTGQITVAKSTINFEATPQFLLQVQATDNGSPANSRTQTIAVNVTNLNEPPVFLAPTTFSITENRPVGYVVGTVNTIDPEGNTLIYSLVGGDPNGQFAINATTGQITVAKATLDHETTPQYLLQVKATDNGSPSQSKTQTITVNVTNLNEPPVFLLPTTFTLPENQPNGTVVGTVATVDPEGNAVTYSIAGGNPNNAFAINPSTGQITVSNTTALDFETTPQFQLQVKAQDNGSPANSRTQTITINLTNVSGARVADRSRSTLTASTVGATGEQIVSTPQPAVTPPKKSRTTTAAAGYSFALTEPLA